jgi:hypothetical protein
MELTLIQSAFFTSYIIFLVKTFGVIPSISESWYRLKPETNLLFTLFCFSLGLPMFFQSNGSSDLFFLSGSGLILVGVAVRFKKSYECKMHYAGGAAAIAGALLGLWFEENIWWPAFMFISVLFYVYFSKIEEKIWWIEIAAFVIISAGLLSRCI